MKKPALFFRKKWLAARRRFGKSNGQTLVEYALIIGSIALVAVSVMFALSSQTGALYSMIGSNLSRMSSS
jgi:Flp pilus assembly pilin Flp